MQEENPSKGKGKEKGKGKADEKGKGKDKKGKQKAGHRTSHAPLKDNICVFSHGQGKDWSSFNTDSEVAASVKKREREGGDPRP